MLAVGALENDRNFPAALRQQFSMMRRNVELEARLIDDLLDLTRIARGKLELQTGDVDFRDVLTLAIDICRPEIEAKRQRLEVKIDAAETKTVGDAVRLQQAIWNLIRNASISLTGSQTRSFSSTTGHVASGVHTSARRSSGSMTQYSGTPCC